MNFGEGGWRVDNFRSIETHARYYVRAEVVSTSGPGRGPARTSAAGAALQTSSRTCLRRPTAACEEFYGTPLSLGEEGAHKIDKVMAVQDVIKNSRRCVLRVRRGAARPRTAEGGIG